MHEMAVIMVKQINSDMAQFTRYIDLRRTVALNITLE